MVTNSWKVLSSPISSRLRSPWYFLSCGLPPIEAYAPIWLFFPMRVGPWTSGFRAHQFAGRGIRTIHARACGENAHAAETAFQLNLETQLIAGHHRLEETGIVYLGEVEDAVVLVRHRAR